MRKRLSSASEQMKVTLRRRGVELVLPRREGVGTLQYVRVQRFSLPRDVATTLGAAGPDTFLVDLDRVLNRARYRYGRGSWHPFVAALDEQLTGPAPPYEHSLLHRYYERFQPDNVHDVLLDGRAPRRVVAGWPAVDLLLDVWSVTERHAADVRLRVGRTGRHWPSQYLGPNTIPHGRDHLERVQVIHTSIRDTGYRPEAFHDGLASGYFMVDGDDYRFVVGHGNHRMAAMTVLGIPRVAVRLRLPHPPVVDRQDLRRWTAECGGLYTMEEATALFDSYFIDDSKDRANALGLS